MKLVWTRPAAADRLDIRAYIAQDNPSAALALDALFSAKAGRLLGHPLLGRPGRVLRILHAARQWPPQSRQ
ncbi:MAG: type II toxin-antitoxin system RelE/ParE family toxin [Proteobacteria bacterium]|nr:type II toxin-antitoxin system RelE/ParE family toxin [Pseudomonadota bacterium]MBS0493237.1 type II toxin-antitoxin system RelE/ParE family toxin [Pseudomonadota bacterium]